VYHDALRIRKDARQAGAPWPTSGDLSKQLITQAKKTPEREWLSNAPVGVMQQALRDLDTEVIVRQRCTSAFVSTSRACRSAWSRVVHSCGPW
jgi:hypothetical protein